MTIPENRRLNVNQAAAQVGLKPAMMRRYCVYGAVVAEKAFFGTRYYWFIDAASLKKMKRRPRGHRLAQTPTPRKERTRIKSK